SSCSLSQVERNRRIVYKGAFLKYKQAPFLITGDILLELVLAWPGIGYLFWSAINSMMSRL
ncbi:MAG: hypothetical protein ACOCRO_10040, partial [Halanaerobiales bacterium]